MKVSKLNFKTTCENYENSAEVLWHGASFVLNGTFSQAEKSFSLC